MKNWKILLVLGLAALLFASQDNAQALVKKKVVVKKTTKIIKVGPPPVAVPPAVSPKPMRVEAVKEKREVARRQARGAEVGICAGLIASIPGVRIEAQNNFPFAELRYGAAYAQGEDANKTTRKHALVFLDLVRRFTPPWYSGVRPYWGIGLNYDAYTTGRVSGAMGWQAYLGFENSLSETGSLFLDLGYGAIRTGFSPDNNGISAMIGYRALL